MVRELGDLLGWNATRFSGLDADRAQRIVERFAPGNQAFAAAVWNRPWHDVFGEETVSPPACNVFHREQASPEDQGEFDEVVETAWEMLQRGGGKHGGGQAGGYEAADEFD
jgi:hypothetical protein